MKIKLDSDTANQIANEAAILRDEVVRAGNNYEYVASEHRAGRVPTGFLVRSGSVFSGARQREYEFLRALYIIGVQGVKFVDTCDQTYAFDIKEALKEEN